MLSFFNCLTAFWKEFRLCRNIVTYRYYFLLYETTIYSVKVYFNGPNIDHIWRPFTPINQLTDFVHFDYYFVCSKENTTWTWTNINDNIQKYLFYCINKLIQYILYRGYILDIIGTFWILLLSLILIEFQVPVENKFNILTLVCLPTFRMNNVFRPPIHKWYTILINPN
jgi:hypothetical protein